MAGAAPPGGEIVPIRWLRRVRFGWRSVIVVEQRSGDVFDISRRRNSQRR